MDNCIAQIGEFVMAGPYAGYTEEELKMIFETRKILHRESLLITATTVRVPIPNSHSISVNVELVPFTLEKSKHYGRNNRV